MDTSTGTGCTAASLSEHKWSPREGREGEGGSAREVVSCLTPHMRRRRDGILSEATALRASRLCSNALQTVRMVGRFTASPGRPRSKRRRHHSNPKRYERSDLDLRQAVLRIDVAKGSASCRRPKRTAPRRPRSRSQHPLYSSFGLSRLRRAACRRQQMGRWGPCPASPASPLPQSSL